MVDMDHMKYLDDVADGDVLVLEKKESTYQGSWKAAGGRSAWFMMRRNMDRLITMMKKPETPKIFNLTNVDDTIEAIKDPLRDGGDSLNNNVKFPGTLEATVDMLQYLRDCYVSENIFAAIRANPSGDDGTVLACLRDLRRYLVLIEAEMMARGVVKPATSSEEMMTIKPAQVDIVSGIVDGYTCAECGKVLPTGPGLPPIWLSSAGVAYCVEHKPGMEAAVKRTVPRKVPKHDGSGQHAPFIVTSDYFLRKGIADDLARAFWQPVNAHSKSVEGMSMEHKLEPHVENHTMPSVLGAYYTLVAGKHWILNIDRVPSEIREMFPALRFEKNAKELDELPWWQQNLYEWLESESKYRLKQQNAAWTKTQ